MAWIGSSSTLQGLQRIAPMLEHLGRALPSLRLRIICDRPITLASLPVEFRPWSPATELHDLAGSDIGISLLPDDDWSRGKCGLKVLQYMAAGLPVVANPVGMQTELVGEGTTGFLARTEDDWRDALSQLAVDADLRRRLGLAGRRRAQRDFDISHGGALWSDLLNNLCNIKPVKTTSKIAQIWKTWSQGGSVGASRASGVRGS